ncbi:MAG: flippase-like domain-containing protein [Solirubrobacteraceae bacterium]|nr:flippase-like domain-containing protein [Solirubrobacteraceae bacterium]
MAASDDSQFAGDFDPAAVRRSAVRVTGLLLAILLIGLLTPGLGTLRNRIGEADVGWLVVAIVLEALSGFSYVLMLKPVFLRGQSWWMAQRLGWSELAMGSIVPSSGVAGLALGAWLFNRVGANPKVIARRSVAFYLIKGAANFVAVAVVGLLMFVGVGPHLSPWLTLFPALISITLMGVVAFYLPRIGPGTPAGEDAGRFRKIVASSRSGLVQAVAEAGEILRRREFAVYFGALGYWFFDNAVLFATFHAFGEDPAFTVILMAYLIGQLGGLIPLPGGIGGVDGGLVGAFVVYGLGAEAAFIAVLAYRVILFWLPLLIGAVAFFSIQKRIRVIEERRDAAEADGEKPAGPADPAEALGDRPVTPEAGEAAD